MILRSIALRQGRRAVARPARCLHTTAVRSQQKPETTTYSFSSRVQPPVQGNEVAQDYHVFQAHKELTGKIGSVVTPLYEPHTQITNPPRPEDITLELLMASQSHLGHSTSLWNPANARYIFGVRQGIHIISLDQTASHLRRACAVVRGVAERGGLILFVGTRDGQARIVTKAAELAGACHLFDRWIPGSITNGPQILGRCRTRVVDENDEEIRGFEEQLDMKGALKPDLVVCLNPLENYILLHECGLNNIPTIGVVDTDVNPTWVTYPIPANDDSLRCINLIGGVLGRAAEAGKAHRLRQASRGNVTYQANHGLEVPTADQIAAAHAYEQSLAHEMIDNEDIDERSVTSSISVDEDRNVQENVDRTMISALEYSQFADFDEDAMDDAFQMHIPESLPAESPELAELRDKLRRNRAAFNVSEDQNEIYIQSKQVDAETGAAFEEETHAMLDEPMTQQEADALYAQEGGKGTNRYEGGSYRAALKLRKADADPTLRRLIAVKRQQFGEELSAEDQEELRQLGGKLNQEDKLRQLGEKLSAEDQEKLRQLGEELSAEDQEKLRQLGEKLSPEDQEELRLLAEARKQVDAADEGV